MNRLINIARRTVSSSVLAAVVFGAMSPSIASAQEADREQERKPKAAESQRFARVAEPQSFSEQERAYDGLFADRPAVQRVRVGGNFFVSKPNDQAIPYSMMDKRIEIDIRSSSPRLSDLQTLLEMQDVAMSIDWRSLSGVKDADAKVGTFTAASRYQQVANSASGGAGTQSNGIGGLGGGGLGLGGLNSGGLGGVNNNLGNTGGLSNSGLGGGNYGSGGLGGNSQGVIIQGSAGTGSGLGGQGGQDGQGGGDRIPDYQSPQGSGLQASRNGGNESGGGAETPTSEEKLANPRLYDRVLPFRYFKGTVGELVQRLENSGELAVWWDHGLVLGETRRFSVAIMQNIDISQSVVNELIRLGARDVVGSIGAGQIFYAASPRINRELIDPYLRRISNNLSEVTLQVALVTVSMTKNAERGFDWSAFNLRLGNGTAVAADAQPISGNGSLSSSAFNLTSNIGLKNPLSIAGAIRFLSRMGDTSVAQNVELRTLSGAPVVLRSGENIPYVQNVGSALAGGLGGGALGNTQTASLSTGLTLNVDPRYDAASGIVTLDVGVKLVDLVEFVQLSAGNQIGTISQPRTREQGLNSIIRVPAGQTTIVGGVRRDLSSDTRSSPFGLWGIGSRNRSREVFWLFTIIRPVVTLYEPLDMSSYPKSVLDTTVTVNPRDDRPGYGYGRGPSDLRQVPGGLVPDPMIQGSPTGVQAVVPNRQPAGVIISEPPAPRNVTVVAPSSPPSVVESPEVPVNGVVRVPVQISRNPQVPGNAVTPGGSPTSLPLSPAPGSDTTIETVTTASPPTVAPRRSFVRPMTAEEQKGNR